MGGGDTEILGYVSHREMKKEELIERKGGEGREGTRKWEG